MANTESNAQSLNSTSGSSGADLGDRTANNLAPGPKQTGDYTDKNAISGRIDFFMAKDRYTRWIFEREWFRNVLYYLGRQWIIYDVTNRRWRPKTLPIWFPQPYTNKFAEKANDVTSAYVQGRVPISYSPASDDPDALATATIAEDFRESFYAETEIEDREETLAKWVTLTGNAFLHTYYDYSPEYGTKLIQDQQCADCGQTAPPADIVANGMKCPQCGSSNLQPAVDENGQPQGQEMPKGRMKADICSAFEMRVDPTIEEFTLQRRATRVRTYDIMFAREYWGGRAGPDGKPIDAKEIVADKEGSIGQFYLDALSYMTASFGAGGGFIAGGGNAFKLPRVSAYEYYELPSDDFPEGIHAVRLGHSANLVVVAEPLDSTYGAGEYAGQKFLPFVHFRGDKVPGRLWAKTRMDDLIPLQNFRNLVESALKLTAQRTGNPLWLNPKGSGVANMTGEPGQWVDYNPVTLGGTSFAKPERVPADLSNVQGFTVLLNKIDDAIERVTGTFFAGGGETPPGVTAACLTDDTECLTKRGWLKHNELNSDDEIYTLNPDTQLGEWHRPLAINRYFYRGELLEAKNNQISVAMTPNHAWYVGTNNNPKRKLERVLAEDLKTHHFIPAQIPYASVSAGGNHSDAFVEMVGWIVAEGSYNIHRTGTIKHDKRGDYTRHVDECTVEISQSQRVNLTNCESIRSCLRTQQIPFSESIDKRTDVLRFRIHGKTARKIVSQFPDKRLTYDFIHSLTTHQLRLLYKTMLKADGSTQILRDGQPHHSEVFCSADPILRDQFQMVATLAGVLTGQPSNYENSLVHKNARYGDEMTRCSVKTAKRIKFRNALKNLQRINYTGVVWCPTTPTGTWVARRDGKVFATGNSALAYLGERAQQSISPMKREWAKGWKRWEMQALEIARANWDDERIVALAGANRHWEVKKFMSADLQGAVKMDVDYQGLFRKSQASKRADIQLLTQLGVLNPQNPEEQWNMLEAFGETKLLGSMDLDIRVATIEFQEFSDYGTPPQLIPMIQNSAAHILQHKKDANSDKFKALPLPMQTAWYQHIREHILDLAMSQQPLIPPGAGQGAPPQGAPGNQPQAGPGGNHATKVPQGAAAKEPKEPGPVAKGKNRAQAEMGNRNSGQNGMAPAAAGGSFAQ